MLCPPSSSSSSASPSLGYGPKPPQHPITVGKDTSRESRGGGGQIGHHELEEANQSRCRGKSRLFSPTVTCQHTDNLGPFLYTWGFSIFWRMPAFPPWTDFLLGCLPALCGCVSLFPPCKAYVGIIGPIRRTKEVQLEVKGF